MESFNQELQQNLNQESLKKCGLCGNDISIEKFRIHDVMCSKHNYKCQKCNLAVPKSEKEHHDSQVCLKEKPQPVNTSNQMQKMEEFKSSLIDEDMKDESQNNKNGLLNLNHGSEEELKAASEREIQRIMQEELNEFEALQFQNQENQFNNNRELSNYEKSKLKAQQKGQFEEGYVRPADQMKHHQLIDGEDEDEDEDHMLDHQDYEGNIFQMADEFQGLPIIKNINQPSNQSNINQQAQNQDQSRLEQFGFSIPEFQTNQIHNFGNIQSTNRVVAQPGEAEDDLHDFKALSEQEAIEEQILKEIMEQSKIDQ